MNRAIMCLQLANAVKQKQKVLISLQCTEMPNYLNTPAFKLGEYTITIRAAYRRYWFDNKDSDKSFTPKFIINPTKVTKNYVVFDKIDAQLPGWAEKLLTYVKWKRLGTILEKRKIYISKIETMEVIK